MADEPRTPVAVRVTRPYATEDEFLANEVETLSRTSITLVGAQTRPQGVVLRFEVALSSGAALVRGEGRVIGFRPNALGDEPGLLLRFTRLDSRSKALVDRAVAIRDARAKPIVVDATPSDMPPPSREPSIEPPSRGPSVPPPAPSSASKLPSKPPPLPPAANRASVRPARVSKPPPSEPTQQTAMPVAEFDLETTRAEAPLAKSASRPPPSFTEPESAPYARIEIPQAPLVPKAPASEPLDLEATRAEVPEAKRDMPRAKRAATPEGAPGDREALLDRLRDRKRGLTEDTVASILRRTR